MLTIWFSAAAMIFIYMNLIYLLSLLLKDSSIVDIAWGPGFVLAFWFVYLNYSAFSPAAMVAGGLLTIWGLRLALHILVRNAGKGEDWRYRKWREDWGKKWLFISYFKVFLLQGLIMWFILFPILVILARASGELWGSSLLIWLALGLGAAISFAGLLVEAIADYQLLKFKSLPENKGNIMKDGLWSVSRHPNYFGEIVFWWGIFFFSLPFGFWWISLISPLMITWLLNKVSGVPMLEKKYKENAQYREYVKSTNAIIPFSFKK